MIGNIFVQLARVLQAYGITAADMYILCNLGGQILNAFRLAWLLWWLCTSLTMSLPITRIITHRNSLGNWLTQNLLNIFLFCRVIFELSVTNKSIFRKNSKGHFYLEMHCLHIKKKSEQKTVFFWTSSRKWIFV